MRATAIAGFPEARKYRKRHRALQLAVAGLMAIAVSRIHDYIPIIGVARPAIALFGFSVAYLMLFPRSADLRNVTREVPGRLVLALIGIFFLSSVFGLSAGASGSFFVSTYSRVVSLFILLVAVIRTPKDLRFFVATYVASILVAVFVTFFLGEVRSYDGYTRVAGTKMYDGNDLGVLYAIGLPLALSLVQSGSLIQRVIGVAGLIGIPGSLALTASRGGFLGLLACVLGLLFLAPGISTLRKLVILAFVSLALFVFAPTGYWGQMATIANVEEDYNLTSETGRMAIWRRGLTYVAQRPILGVGPDNFIRAGWEISMEARYGLGLRNQAPHNTFLQFWAEMGTLGLLTVLAILLSCTKQLLSLRASVRKSWVRGSPDQRFLFALSSYLPVCLFGFSVSAFFVTHAYTPMFYIATAFSCTVLTLGRVELQQGRSARNHKARPRSSSAEVVDANKGWRAVQESK